GHADRDPGAAAAAADAAARGRCGRRYAKRGWREPRFGPAPVAQRQLTPGLPEWRDGFELNSTAARSARPQSRCREETGVVDMQSMLKKQLQRAFQLGELQVHYQPKFHLATGGLHGVEALLRWRTVSGQWIAPATFVPVLEDTGLIDDVGIWLFQRTAADAAYWRCQGCDVGRVAINVSLLQLRRAGFLDWVLAISSSWSEWGASLELELTESSLLPDPAAMVEPMNALAAANVRFALD